MDKNILGYFTSSFVNLISNERPLEEFIELIHAIFNHAKIDEYSIYFQLFQKKEFDIKAPTSTGLNKPQFTQKETVYYDRVPFSIIKYNGSLITDDSALLVKAILTYLYLQDIKNNKIDSQLLKNDLEIAAKMQRNLIPETIFNLPEFKAEGLYKPIQMIGGDYYDIIQISDNKIAFCMADISGKGVNAAIVMSNFTAILKSILIREYPLEQTIDMLNYKLFELTKGEKFITLFLGLYNINDRRLVYVNCGHNPVAFYTSSKFLWLEEGTTILGALESLPFLEIGKVYIDEPAKILLYTDGLLNIKNDKNQFFDLRELENIIQSDLTNLNQSETIDYLAKKIEEIEVEVSMQDDISILSIELC